MRSLSRKKGSRGRWFAGGLDLLFFIECLLLCTGCGTQETSDVRRSDNGVGSGNSIESDNNAGSDNDIESDNGIVAQDIPEKPVSFLDVSPEEMLSCETGNDQGTEYLVITGIAEDKKELFEAYMTDMEQHRIGGVCLQIPGEMEGISVREIGTEAFADMEIPKVEFPDTVKVIGDGAFRDTGLSSLNLPPGLEKIGAEAFENCCLQRVEFPDCPVVVGERGFAGNKELWTVFAADVGTMFGKDAFADCSEQFLLCYGDDSEGRENLVAEYARENGLDSREIILSQEPIVHYHEELLSLQPRVDNFFYGEDGDEETEQWCSWEYDENAPNFGYDDWQWPGCSSWCGVMDFIQEAEATSELASGSDRYAVENVLRQSRMAAWAEGVAGDGIGESITYRQACTGLVDNAWEQMGPEYREPVVDGFMRYTEICIVNGYAKDLKTWEENGRVRTLLMYVENKPYARLELEDTILPQYFALPEDDIKVLNGGMLEVRFEIMEVYPGSVYEDTCLTGLIMEFSGRYAH